MKYPLTLSTSYPLYLANSSIIAQTAIHSDHSNSNTFTIPHARRGISAGDYEKCIKYHLNWYRKWEFNTFVSPGMYFVVLIKHICSGPVSIMKMKIDFLPDGFWVKKEGPRWMDGVDCEASLRHLIASETVSNGIACCANVTRSIPIPLNLQVVSNRNYSKWNKNTKFHEGPEMMALKWIGAYHNFETSH